MFSHPEGYSIALEYSYCRGNVGLLCRDFGNPGRKSKILNKIF